LFKLLISLLFKLLIVLPELCFPQDDFLSMIPQHGDQLLLMIIWLDSGGFREMNRILYGFELIDEELVLCLFEVNKLIA